MAIIYTYPTKATLALTDTVLISDSADSNKTKNATITSIKDAIDVVDSITATLPLEATPSTGAVTISSRAYGGGDTTGFVPSGGTAGNYLDGAGNWSTPAGTGGPGTGTEDTVPIWSTTSTLGDSLITQNALGTVLNVGTNIASFSTVAGVGSVFTTRVSVNGYSTFGGKLKLDSPDGATHVTIEGPANGGSPYTLKFPSAAPTNNQVLEYTTSGNLGWIPTPTGSGISFSGATVDGIATFASTSSATVNSEVKLAASGQMTFDGSGGNVGIKYDVGSTTLRVGDVGGNSESVALYSDGAAKITISASDVTVVDTTQFNSGLKFGSTGETLNSYEEGTWTPTSGNANTISSVGGDYTRIGNMVFAQFSFTMTGATTVVISGLPFQGVYTSSLKGGVIISADSCTFVQGQLKGGQFTGASSFTFNSYNGSGSGLPTQLRQVTSSLYQTSGGTYAGIIIYETTA